MEQQAVQGHARGHLNLTVAAKIEGVSSYTPLIDLMDSLGDIRTITDVTRFLACTQPTSSFTWAVKELKDLKRYLTYLDAYIDHAGFLRTSSIFCLVQKAFQQFTPTLSETIDELEPFAKFVAKAETDQQKCQLTYQIKEIEEKLSILRNATRALNARLNREAITHYVNGMFGAPVNAIKECQVVARLVSEVVCHTQAPLNCVRRQEGASGKRASDVHNQMEKAQLENAILYTQVWGLNDVLHNYPQERFSIMNFILEFGRELLGASDPMQRVKIFNSMYLELYTSCLDLIVNLSSRCGHDETAFEHYRNALEAQKESVTTTFTATLERCDSADEYLREIKSEVLASQDQMVQLATDNGAMHFITNGEINPDQTSSIAQMKSVVKLLRDSTLIECLILDPQGVIEDGVEADYRAGGGGGGGAAGD